jgi:hypothetical protein
MSEMLQRNHWIGFLACLLTVLFSPNMALAQAFAVVESISEPDTRGRWKQVKETAQAAKFVGIERTNLTVGLALDLGDRVATDRARVTIRIGKGEHITVREGGEVVLRERSVLQSMGEVYYQVRGLFSVDYGTVQTAVEGTEFAISGRDGPVTVAVTDGVVKVSSEGEAVRVRRGQVVSVPLNAAPLAPMRMAASQRFATSGKAWSLGRPRLQLGAVGGLGLLGGEAGAESRLFAALRLLPGMNLTAQTALGGLGGLKGLRIPGSLGVEAVVGVLSVGGEGQITVERWRYLCGGRHIAVHLGGALTGRITIPVTRRLFLASTGRVGHDGSGLEASAGFGGGVSL